MRGRDREHDFRVLQRLLERVGWPNAFWQFDAGHEQFILAASQNALDDFSLISPKPDGVADPSERDGKGSAPIAGSDDRDFPHDDSSQTSQLVAQLPPFEVGLGGASKWKSRKI